MPQQGHKSRLFLVLLVYGNLVIAACEVESEEIFSAMQSIKYVVDFWYLMNVFLCYVVQPAIVDTDPCSSDFLSQYHNRKCPRRSRFSNDARSFFCSLVLLHFLLLKIWYTTRRPTVRSRISRVYLMSKPLADSEVSRSTRYN